MQKIIIIESVRFLGVGYSPGNPAIEVDDKTAVELIRLGFALPEEQPTAADSDKPKVRTKRISHA